MSDIRKFFSMKPGTGGASKLKPAASTGGDSSQKENKATPAPVSTKSSGSPAKKPTSPAKKTKQEDKAKAEASPAKPAAKKSKYFDGSSVKQERSGDDAGGAATQPKAEEPSLPAGTKRPRAVVIEISSDNDSDAVIVNEAPTTQPTQPSSQRPSAKNTPAAAAKASGAAASAGTSAGPSKRALPGSLQTPASQPKQPASQATPMDTSEPDASQDVPKTSGKASGKGSGKGSGKASGKSSASPGSGSALVSPKGGRSSGKGKAALDPEVQAAVDATDRAVSALPPESEVKFTFVNVEGMQPPDEPENLGQKELPRGHDECLTGKTFVITGVQDSLKRDDMKELIQRHSGKVTTAVSGKTSFLIMGQHCGKSKYEGAQRHNTKIIDEDGLFSLIRASSHLIQQQPAPQPPLPPAGSQRPQAQSAPSAGARAGPSGTAMQGCARSAPSLGAGANRTASGSQLWVDKYKPKSSTELVGNPGVIKTLATWLRQWDAINIHGQEPQAQAGSGKPKDLKKKAVLLSGQPGIGKTSAAHIIARELGYKVVEVNASDTRNKSDAKITAGMNNKLSNVVREMATNTSLLFDTEAGGTTPLKQLLIMDEVDGMSGGDRGGVSDLIQTIHKTKVPIICIANDKYCQKLKSLRNHCLELDFHKPTDDQVVRRVSLIAANEGLKVNDATLRELAKISNGDLRLVLGQLQMVRLRSAALSYDDVKGKLGTSKDADQSPFECARKLLGLESKNIRTADKMDLVFADFDLVPLLIQENYVSHNPAISTNDMDRMRALAKAAECISNGDVLGTAIRRSGNWGLMPAAGLVGSVMPATYMAGPMEVFGLYPTEKAFPRFTAWLGNYSTSTKQKRLLSELSTSMAASGHVPLHRGVLRLDYLSALRVLLTQALRKEGEAGIEPTVHLMQEYCINREQFDFILDVTKFKTKGLWGKDPYDEVETKVKSAFTRYFNKEGGVTARTGKMLEEDGYKKLRGSGAAKGPKKGKGRRTHPNMEFIEGGETLAEEEVAEEPQEEEDTEDEEELQRRLAQDGVVIEAAPTKGKAGGRASGAGGGRGRGSGKASGGGRGSGKASGSGSRGGRGGKAK